MKLLLCSALVCVAATAFAFSPFPGPGDPNPIRETIFYAKNGNPDWLIIREGITVSASDLTRLYKTDLGLTEQDELVQYRVETDPQGMTHRRYQQYHRGVQVDGGELLIHERNGRVSTLNGKLVRGLELEPQTQLSAGEAIQRALAHVSAKRYMWEVPAAEAMLKRIRKNAKATYYPQPELVLVDPTQAQDADQFQEAWSLTVFAEQPQSKKTIFVSARTGAILLEINLLHDQSSNTPGTADTKYSGTRQIITDSVDAGVYRLFETTRGGGVQALNMKRSTDYSQAEEFLDADNHWNNVNPQQDEAATDAYWGSEMTYDYYAANHDYHGIDGQDMPLIAYVHFDNNWSNAQWTGDFAQFGDGDGVSWKALTSLDVVGHEFTHGVTENTAHLRYQNESGALNESFSDIFGAAIEFWADPDHADWLMGEDFVALGGPLRNMGNPKAQGNPDTYKGTNWATGTADNGGVHTNSGVQNHWFFLLTDGSSGINDNEDSYAVAGIGLNDAADIAFRNLHYYLVQQSGYRDAREGSIQAAEDLFGACSPQQVQTAKAWYAVGVGNEIQDYDLNMLKITQPDPKSCGLTNAEFIGVQFRFNGCNVDLQPGDKIPVAYSINNGTPVWDTLTLANSVSGGDTINYVFSKPTDVFATSGTYQLRCWTGLDADLELDNNLVSGSVESFTAQNVDFGVKNVTNLVGGCFLGTQSPGVDIGFFGCDSISANQILTLYYNVDGGVPKSETVKLTKTLYRGQTFHHDFSSWIDFSNKGLYSVNAWLEYSPDYLNNNDSLIGFKIVNPLPMFKEDVLTFEADNGSRDSFYTINARETQATITTKAARTGALGLEVTGGDLEQAYKNGQVQNPTKDNVWKINTAFRSRTCICADLTNLASADLRFDRRQTYSYFFYNALGFNAPYASALHILANDEQIGQTYKPTTHNSDPWTTQKISLNGYVGTQTEICFESHTGISPAYDTSGVGDRVLLDNITITGQLVSGTNGIAPASPQWTVMPNPGTGFFTISIQMPDAQALVVEVVDALGHTIRKQSASLSPGRQVIPLNLEGTAPGVYFLRLGSEQEKSVRKIVISGQR